MPRGIAAKQFHEIACLYYIIFQQGLNGVFVFFAAYVLVGREIGDYVESAVVAHYILENGVCEVERIGEKYFGHSQGSARTEVSREFRKAVFVKVDYYKFRGVERQQSLDE